MRASVVAATASAFRGVDLVASPRRQFAFTLVELLVVLAIIGGLVALLLPAVQAARESARLGQCFSNLHEIGTALAIYEGRFRKFPVGCIGCRVIAAEGEAAPEERYHSWNVQILPELEQRTAWDRYDFAKPSYVEPNRSVGATQLAAFLCPSTEPDDRLSPRGSWRGMAFTDYGGVYGVEGKDRDEPDFAAAQTLNERSLGVFVYEAAVPSRAIKDGLSGTVAVAELQLRRQSNPKQDCECEWVNGQNLFAQEQTTPINNASGLGNDIGGPHPGGATLCFCDGHVQFLAEGTDPEIVNALLTRAGEETP